MRKYEKKKNKVEKDKKTYVHEKNKKKEKRKRKENKKKEKRKRKENLPTRNAAIRARAQFSCNFRPSSVPASVACEM